MQKFFIKVLGGGLSFFTLRALVMEMFDVENAWAACFDITIAKLHEDEYRQVSFIYGVHGLHGLEPIRQISE